ncbi:MAG: helix-turn-helix transcriptional regulator [Clostridiales bacterium]|jgi:transcriptional regulator with XRE-family HTH domain|nr:helix-turn-helix transcriptional regulator [Clostridiales bacterium]
MKEKKEINVEIGKRIKQVRENAGLTQEKLAELLQISPQHLSNLERGTVGISVSTLKLLCDTLYVSVDFMLLGTTPEPSSSFLEQKLSRLSAEQQDILHSLFNLLMELITASQKESPSI